MAERNQPVSNGFSRIRQMNAFPAAFHRHQGEVLARGVPFASPLLFAKNHVKIRIQSVYDKMLLAADHKPPVIFAYRGADRFDGAGHRGFKKSARRAASAVHNRRDKFLRQVFPPEPENTFSAKAGEQNRHTHGRILTAELFGNDGVLQHSHVAAIEGLWIMDTDKPQFRGFSEHIFRIIPPLGQLENLFLVKLAFCKGPGRFLDFLLRLAQFKFHWSSLLMIRRKQAFQPAGIKFLFPALDGVNRINPPITIVKRKSARYGPQWAIKAFKMTLKY